LREWLEVRLRPSYVLAMAEPGMSEHLQQMLARTRALLRPVVPRRWRADLALVPVVRMTGIIGFSTPLRPGLTLSNVARSLERAFAMRRAKAVALAINSPGGSAVQSHLIFQRIRRLAQEKNLPVIAFVEDAGASGGYMIACAADEIIADASSIVGSIGVMGGSFGFDKLMQRLGIERRLYTAGEHKAMLDPFLPENPDDVERLKAIQGEIHANFIALVKERRGAKLTGPEKTLFSGEFWTGARAVELGVADAIGDLRTVLRERFGEQVVTPLVMAERGFLGRRVPAIGTSAIDTFASRPGLAEEIISALEARAIWARYGL
jgi:signal peptide peptidase SppA